MSQEILTDEDIDFSKVGDYITFLIYYIGYEKGLSKKLIHKTCFAIKKEGRANIEINKKLPFYWYYFGPFSNVVQNAIDIAVEEGIIYPKTEDNHTRYFLNDFVNYKPPNSIEVDKISKIIQSLQITWFGTEDLTEYIYKKYAPRIFRYNFYKTWNHINSCAENIPNRTFRQEQFFNAYRNKIYDCLIKSEGTLPRDTLFERYNSLFSYYVMSLHRIFNDKRKVNDDIIEYLYCLKSISEEVWKIFGEGERILSHDNYSVYKNCLPRWNKTYLSHLDELKKTLYELDNHIIELIGEENLKQKYTDKEKEFLVTVLSEG